LNKISTFIHITKNHYYPKTDVFYLRYADDILFYGFRDKETFLFIKEEVINF